MTDKQPSTTAALGISVQCAAGGHQIVFQTHVAQDATKAQLDELTDRLIAVADRQQAKATLLDLKRNALVQEEQLTNLRKDRDRIDQSLAAAASDTNGRRTAQIPASQKQAREQSFVMEEKLIAVIKRFRDQIRETEAVVAGR